MSQLIKEKVHANQFCHHPPTNANSLYLNKQLLQERLLVSSACFYFLFCFFSLFSSIEDLGAKTWFAMYMTLLVSSGFILRWPFTCPGEKGKCQEEMYSGFDC